MIISMKWVPNAITLLNLLIGCVAVSMAFAGELFQAALFTALCSILDFLDGAIARYLKAGSETGKQLDALADLISFGMTPAVVMFSYITNSLQEVNQQYGVFVLPYIAFLLTAFSALRLARFSSAKEESSWFTGLPTPANALLIVSVPFVLHISTDASFVFRMLDSFTSNTVAIIIAVLGLSYLMVAPVRMFSLKAKSLKWRENRIRYLYLAGCLLLLITFGLPAAPLFLIFYIILSFFKNIPGCCDKL